MGLFEDMEEAPTIFKDVNVLSPHYVPKELPFRERHINEITSILSPALKGQKPRNLIIYGKTGTGKTASFCLPILNKLAKNPSSIFAIILEPTRELALQVIEKLKIYSVGFNLRTSLIILITQLKPLTLILFLHILRSKSCILVIILFAWYKSF